MGNQKPTRSPWGIAAIIAGSLAVITAPLMGALVFRALDWLHQPREAHLTLAPMALLVPATVALVLSVIAVSKRAQRAKGAVGIVLAVVASMGVGATEWLRSTHGSMVCHGNLIQLSVSCLQYAADYDGSLPVVRDWPAVTLPYYHNPMVLACPADYSQTPDTVGIARTSYCLNSALRGVNINSVKNATEVVLLFDGTAPIGGVECAEFRHTGRARVNYVSGAGEWVSPEELLAAPQPVETGD